MFYADGCVRSRYHGYGCVVQPGPDPVVCFLDGCTSKVAGATLRHTSAAIYDAEARNHWEIECWLDLRIHGRALRPRLPLPGPSVDLTTRMAQAITFLPAPSRSGSASGLAWFVAEELNGGPGGPGASPLPVDPRPVRVEVRPVASHA